MKIKLSPARELDFEGPGHPKLDPKTTKICLKSSQDRLKSLLGAVLEGFLSSKCAQERPKGVPKASKSVPRASQERPRARQERPKSGLGVSMWLYLVVEGCIWLQVVVVQRRWEADGEGGER